MAIATGTAIALGVAAGASAGGQIYAAKRSGDINEQSIKAQAASEEASRQAQLQAQERDLTLQREQQATAEADRIRTEQQAEKARADTLAESQREFNANQSYQTGDLAYRQHAYEAQVAQDKQRYDAYVAANTPYWQLGTKVLGNLFDIAQVGKPGAPQGAPPPGVMSGMASGASASADSAPPLPSSAPMGGPTSGLPAGPAPSGGVPAAMTSRGGLSLADLLQLSQAGASSAPPAPASSSTPASTRGPSFTTHPMPRAGTSQGGGSSLLDFIQKYLALQKAGAADPAGAR